LAERKRSLAAQARAQNAYALVERAVWWAQGGAPLAVLVEGDARMAESIHVMRSFRVNHPAGKMFVAWIAGPRGRHVVAAQRGYRPLVA
jgi:tungstate transport system substrate-binding protein